MLVLKSKIHLNEYFVAKILVDELWGKIDYYAKWGQTFFQHLNPPTIF